MKWQRYPQYKNSGIEWLGKVPEQWSVLRIKRLCMVKRGASPRPIYDPKYFDEKGEYSWVRIADVTASNHYLKITTQKLSELGKSLSVPIAPGDIFLSIAGSVGKAIITQIKCCIHDGFVYFPNYKEKKEFLFYIFSSGQPYFGLGKWGTQLNLNTGTVGDIYVGMPSKEEQAAIATFLDRETSRIDKLIEKKEKQIELLKEKRAALISHAVTKGLDTNVKMKDSGIQWLGEIPESWEVRKLKHIASVKFSNVDKKITEGQQIVRLCNYVDVYYNEFITYDLNLMNASASTEEIVRFSLKEGDVLITKDSESWADIAVPAYVSLDLAGVVCGYHLAQVRPKTALVDGKYLFRSFCFQGINYQYRVEATGITRYGLGKYWLDNSLFLLPPKEEQQAISTFLDRETGKIDALIEKIKKSIELLKEYRTAIISAAVTGKIDVRGTV
jgi:type I restriction enzyme S subunit